jgi:hypothetical protein
MVHHSENERAGDGAPAQLSSSSIGREAAITAAAVIMPRARSAGNRLIVTLRRNPKPGRRGWVVSLDACPPFDIRIEQLLERDRFLNVMLHRQHKYLVQLIERDARAFSDLIALPPPQTWRYLVEDTVAVIVRGGAS